MRGWHDPPPMMKRIAFAIIMSVSAVCGEENTATFIADTNKDYNVVFAEVDIPTRIIYEVAGKKWEVRVRKSITPRESFGLSQLLFIFSSNMSWGPVSEKSFFLYLDKYNLRRHLVQVK